MPISRYIVVAALEARLGLRVIAGAPVVLSEAEVAVGHERAHLEGLGEGQRLVVALASR